MRFVFALLILLLTSPAVAQDESESPRETPRLQADGMQPADPDLQRLRGLDAERTALLRDLRVARATALEEALEANRLEIEALATRLADAILPSERMAIEREVERVKFEGDVQLLVIQAEFARRAGLEDAATSMDAAIEAMRARREDVVRDRAPVQE